MEKKIFCSCWDWKNNIKLYRATFFYSFVNTSLLLQVLTELVSCLVPVQEATGEQPSVADRHNDCPSLQLHKRPLPGKSATQYCNCHVKNLGHSRSITCFSSPLVFHLHQFFSNAHLYQKYGECIDWLPLTFDLIMLPAWDTTWQRSRSASVAVAVKSQT